LHSCLILNRLTAGGLSDFDCGRLWMPPSAFQIFATALFEPRFVKNIGLVGKHEIVLRY